MADEGGKAITIRLPEDLHDQLRERAAREERTVAGLLRIAARLYLRTEEALPPAGA